MHILMLCFFLVIYFQNKEEIPATSFVSLIFFYVYETGGNPAVLVVFFLEHKNTK